MLCFSLSHCFLSCTLVRQSSLGLFYFYTSCWVYQICKALTALLPGPCPRVANLGRLGNKPSQLLHNPTVCLSSIWADCGDPAGLEGKYADTHASHYAVIKSFVFDPGTSKYKQVSLSPCVQGKIKSQT